MISQFPADIVVGVNCFYAFYIKAVWMTGLTIQNANAGK